MSSHVAAGSVMLDVYSLWFPSSSCCCLRCRRQFQAVGCCGRSGLRCQCESWCESWSRSSFKHKYCCMLCLVLAALHVHMIRRLAHDFSLSASSGSMWWLGDTLIGCCYVRVSVVMIKDGASSGVDMTEHKAEGHSGAAYHADRAACGLVVSVWRKKSKF